MVIDTDSAFRAVSIVLQNHEARNTARQSVGTGVLTALGTFVGCMAAGPRGIIPGAAISAGVAYLLKKGTFKSMIEVIQEDLSYSERRELIANVQQVISQFGIDDVAMLLSIATGNENFQRVILQTVTSFVNNHVEMKY